MEQERNKITLKKKKKKTQITQFYNNQGSDFGKGKDT